MEGTRDSAVTRSTGLDEDLMKWEDDERAPLMARIDERSSEKKCTTNLCLDSSFWLAILYYSCHQLSSCTGYHL